MGPHVGRPAGVFWGPHTEEDAPALNRGLRVACSILQDSLDGVTAEQLRRAFRAVPSLTDDDAAFQAKDAFGILARGLSPEDAARLAEALRQEGIATHVVEQSALPVLPVPRALTRAEPREEHLVIFDTLGRPQQVDWPAVILIAAGNVSQRRFDRRRVYDVVAQADGTVLQPNLEVHEVRKSEPLAEVILDAEPPRLRISPHAFHYGYLGERVRPRSSDNFLLLVRDLAARATAAMLTRGAEMLLADPPTPLNYPSIRAFEEETIWHLWARQGPG